MTERQHPDPAVRRALEQSRLTVPTIAKGIGMTTDTVTSWLIGRRRPTMESRIKLATFLSSHSKLTAGLARELRKKPPKEPRQ